MLTATLRLPFPVNLRLTLAGMTGVRFGGRNLPPGAWWATLTPQGPVTTHLTVTDEVVEAEAWGSGADWAMEQVPRLVGVDDHPEAFQPGHSLLERLRHELKGLRLGRTDRPFAALVPTILEQKVAGKEARRSYRRILHRYGEEAPGPVSLRLPPAPETLAALSYYDLHPLGVEQRRARTTIEVASRAAKIEEITEMSREDGYRRLLAFRGVGAWTAAKVMAEATGDPDAVPIGDFHLPNIVSWALAEEPRGTDERMLELLETYRGQRGRVVKMLKVAGVKAPAFGPRAPLRAFEQH